MNGLHRLLSTVMVTLLFLGALTLVAIYETQGNDPFRPVPGNRATAEVVTQNMVVSGNRLIEDRTPLYLSGKPISRCAAPRNHCQVPGTTMGSGVRLTAVCFTVGEGMTNMNLRSSSGRRNPERISSDLWYGTVAPGGALAYVSEVYLTRASRGGLGLRSCPQ